MFASPRLGAQHDWAIRELQQLAGDTLGADPGSKRAAARGRLDRGAEVLYGRVVDVLPYFGAYKVQAERGLPTLICNYLSPGPNGVVGARAVSSIPVGSHVWFILHNTLAYGSIIGVEPNYMTDATRALAESWFLGSRCGFQVDNAYTAPLRTDTRGIADWSDGRPLDSTGAGEWGAITRTGLRIMLDDFMAHMGVSESCGVFAFLFDQLLRISGRNLQIRGGGVEHDLLDDAGELFDVRAASIYPWELFGLPRAGARNGRTFSAQATQIDEPQYGPEEPQYDDQIPVRRRYDFGGFLGQGGRRTVLAPTTEEVWRQSADQQAVTLFEEQIALTGDYALRSAGRVILARSPRMSAITPRRRPDDPAGDTAENYSPSAMDGTVLRRGPSLAESGSAFIDESQVRMSAVDDTLAYIFNWESVHPFVKHERDWNTTEEADAAVGDGLAIPDFSMLAENARTFLPGPATASVWVDHRYGAVDYALSSSVIAMLDDGSITIADGYGGELRLGGGSVTAAAPGDIWLRSGRNVALWGGRDGLARARNSVDVTAASGDVRIKADRHLWALAGNGGGSGMLLLESRAPAQNIQFESESTPLLGSDARAGGIALRALGAPIIAWSQDIYLRTTQGFVTGSNGAERSTFAGDIVLDAGAGKRNIVHHSYADLAYHPPAGGSYRAFYTQTGNDLRTIRTQTSHVQIRNQLSIDGNITTAGFLGVDGAMYVNGWIYVDTGHIATANAADYNYLVPSIQADSIQSWFDDNKKHRKETNKAIDSFWRAGIGDRFYNQQRAGHAKTVAAAEFSLRTQQQYGTNNFHIYEDRWQRLSRLRGDTPTLWTEPAVYSRGVETRPFPGTEALSSDAGMYLVDTTLLDTDDGKLSPKPRKVDDEFAEYYAEPRFPAPELVPINDHYRVTG